MAEGGAGAEALAALEAQWRVHTRWFETGWRNDEVLHGMDFLDEAGYDSVEQDEEDEGPEGGFNLPVGVASGCQGCLPAASSLLHSWMPQLQWCC